MHRGEPGGHRAPLDLLGVRYHGGVAGLWDRTERRPLLAGHWSILVRACVCVCCGEGGIALHEGPVSWLFHQSENLHLTQAPRHRWTRKPRLLG